MKIGEKVKYLRRHAVMTQEELAKLAGTSRTTIIYIEKDKPVNVGSKVLEGIAQALDVPMSELFLPVTVRPSRTNN